MKVDYKYLTRGEMIFLANCTVEKERVTCGFAYFSSKSPLSFSLHHNGQFVAECKIPKEAEDCAHPIALGDADTPIELKRIR